MAPMDPLEISGYTDIQLFARGDFFAYYRAQAFGLPTIPLSSSNSLFSRPPITSSMSGLEYEFQLLQETLN